MLVSAASKKNISVFLIIFGFPFFYEANFMEESYACLNIH